MRRIAQRKFTHEHITTGYERSLTYFGPLAQRIKIDTSGNEGLSQVSPTRLQRVCPRGRYKFDIQQSFMAFNKTELTSLRVRLQPLYLYFTQSVAHPTDSHELLSTRTACPLESMPIQAFQVNHEAVPDRDGSWDFVGFQELQELAQREQRHQTGHQKIVVGIIRAQIMPTKTIVKQPHYNLHCHC